MASAHEDACDSAGCENETEVPKAPAAPAHKLHCIVDAPSNAAVAAALPAASDAKGVTAVGAGEDDEDRGARAVALPYVCVVLPAGEDEADELPI